MDGGVDPPRQGLTGGVDACRRGSLVEWTRVGGGSLVEWMHDGGCSRFGGFGRIVFDLGDLGCGRWVADR